MLGITNCLEFEGVKIITISATLTLTGEQLCNVLSSPAIDRLINFAVVTIIRLCYVEKVEGDEETNRSTEGFRLAVPDRYVTTSQFDDKEIRVVLLVCIHCIGRCELFRLHTVHNYWSFWLRSNVERLQRRAAFVRRMANVFFSKESRFCLGMHDSHRRIRRLHGDERDIGLLKTVRIIVNGLMASYGRKSHYMPR